MSEKRSPWSWPRASTPRSMPPRRSRSPTRCCPRSSTPRRRWRRARPRSGTRPRATFSSTPSSATRRQRSRLLRARITSWPWTFTSIASPACRSSRARRSAITTPRPPATPSTPAAAAPCARSASWLPCSAWRRIACAFFPTTWAEISARAIASLSSSGSSCGPRAGSAVRSNIPRRAQKHSSATTRAAISSPGSSSRSTLTGAFWRCAPPISAMWAHAASRSRRCPKVPASFPGLMRSRPRRCARSRSSPTPRRPRPTAAPAARKSPSPSSASSILQPRASLSTASSCAAGT